jgi:dTDP-glucose 4,6-dehydratase
VNPVGPRGVYDEAKRFMEAMTMASPTTAWRHTLSVYSIHTGPGMWLNDCRVLITNIVQVLRGEDLTIFDDGSQTR